MKNNYLTSFAQEARREAWTDCKHLFVISDCTLAFYPVDYIFCGAPMCFRLVLHLKHITALT